MTQSLPVGHAFAAEKRAEIRAQALAMGIDEAFLSDLVDEFYRRVRADARLGPIFEAAIKDDWSPHLVRMKAFWASVALSAASYSGRPVPVHQKLTDVQRDDFQRWLGLFSDTLDDIAPTPDAAAYLMDRARRIARSLEMAMFDRLGPVGGVPDLG